MKPLLLLMVLSQLAFGAKGPQVGEVAPTATLPTHQGKKIAIGEFAKKSGKRNLLLVFFRTGTCGICIQQLQEFARDLKQIHAMNAAVLAVSLDDAIVHARTSDKIQGKIPLLLDPGAKVVKGFGVLNPQENLAFPSVFVLGPDQKVLYRYVGKGLRDRPPLKEVEDVLRHYSGLVPKRASK